MKTFKEHMLEETDPFAQTNGFVGVDDEKVRDNINGLLSAVTIKPFITPHIGLERVSKVLANYHIHLPKQTFEDMDNDYAVFEVNQFGQKSGMTNDGEVVTKMSSSYYIYFEYNLNDMGSYDVFCELVDEEDLNELIDESDEAEELDENYHPSYTSAIQTAIAHAKKRGYEVDKDDYDSKVSSGPRKPSEGKTVSHNLKLTKDGKPTKKGLAIQVYNRGGDKTPYELNHYISEEQVNEGYTVLGKYTDSSGNKVGTMHKFDNAKSAEEAKRKAYSKVKRKIGRVSDWKTSRISTNEETLNEVGDTPAGKRAINKVALRGDAEIVYQATRSRPQKKKLNKAMKAVDLAVNTHERRGGNVLGGYLKHAYGLDEMEDKSVVGPGTITSTDPKTGKKTDYISPVTKNNPFMQASPDKFKMPNPVPLPPVRPKNLEEANPAREGEIAAGRKGSNPAEQGAIAVKKDDEARDRKANFKVVQKLARQASKEAVKKAMEKKSKK